MFKKDAGKKMRSVILRTSADLIDTLEDEPRKKLEEKIKDDFKSQNLPLDKTHLNAYFEGVLAGKAAEDACSDISMALIIVAGKMLRDKQGDIEKKVDEAMKSLEEGK